MSPAHSVADLSKKHRLHHSLEVPSEPERSGQWFQRRPWSEPSALIPCTYRSILGPSSLCPSEPTGGRAPPPRSRGHRRLDQANLGLTRLACDAPRLRQRQRAASHLPPDVGAESGLSPIACHPARDQAPLRRRYHATHSPAHGHRLPHTPPVVRQAELDESTGPGSGRVEYTRLRANVRADPMARLAGRLSTTIGGVESGRTRGPSISGPSVDGPRSSQAPPGSCHPGARGIGRPGATSCSIAPRVALRSAASSPEAPVVRSTASRGPLCTTDSSAHDRCALRAIQRVTIVTLARRSQPAWL